MSDDLQKKLKVFLCYAREDGSVATEVYFKLKKIDWIDPWMDSKNILLGEDFDLAIDRAVKRADIVIFFLSKSSAKEGYVQRELRYILDSAEQKPEGTIFIIPLRIDTESTVPRRLNWVHYCDYFVENRSESDFRLLDSLIFKATDLGINTITNEGKSLLIEDIYIPPSLETLNKINKNQEPTNGLNNFQFKLPYTRWATCRNPGILIYIVDVSRSMGDSYLGKRKIDFVNDLLGMTLPEIIRYSKDGGRILPTYKIGIFAYAEDVENFYGGLEWLDKLPGLPDLKIMNESTDTAKAFADVLALLELELENMQESPAPIIFHITDGEYTGDDPEPFARRIMSTKTRHGESLLLNILISENMLSNPVEDLSKWGGVKKNTDVKQKYAKKLLNMSSKIPERYEKRLKESGFSIKSGAKLLFPLDALEIASKIFAAPNSRFER